MNADEGGTRGFRLFISVLGTITGGAITFWSLLQIADEINSLPRPGSAVSPWQDAIVLTLATGVIGAAIHGIVWWFLDYFHWKGRYGGGGGGENLPRGSAAVALSLTLTVGILGAPVLVSRWSGVPIIPQRHLLAGSVVAIACAIAHLLIYGNVSGSFPGARRMIMGSDPAHLRLWKEYAVLFCYVMLLMLSLIVPYHLVTRSVSIEALKSAITWVVLGGTPPLFAGVAVLSAQYPDHLPDPRKDEMRGIVVNLVLVIAATGALYFSS